MGGNPECSNSFTHQSWVVILPEDNVFFPFFFFKRTLKHLWGHWVFMDWFLKTRRAISKSWHGSGSGSGFGSGLGVRLYLGGCSVFGLGLELLLWVGGLAWGSIWCWRWLCLSLCNQFWSSVQFVQCSQHQRVWFPKAKSLSQTKSYAVPGIILLYKKKTCSHMSVLFK